MTGDEAIPILHKVYDGGGAEVSQVVTARESLRTLAGPRQLLMVGDSKLVSDPNLAAMVNAGVDFIAPASKTYVPASTLARCELASATPVAYAASRASAKKPEDRGSYRVSEDTMTLTGKHQRDRQHRPHTGRGDTPTAHSLSATTSARSAPVGTGHHRWPASAGWRTTRPRPYVAARRPTT